jgi:hypothetical protein
MRLNPKAELRNPIEGRSPKSDNDFGQWSAGSPRRLWLRTSRFGLRVSDLESPCVSYSAV